MKKILSAFILTFIGFSSLSLATVIIEFNHGDFRSVHHRRHCVSYCEHYHTVVVRHLTIENQARAIQDCKLACHARFSPPAPIIAPAPLVVVPTPPVIVGPPVIIGPYYHHHHHRHHSHHHHHGGHHGGHHRH